MTFITTTCPECGPTDVALDGLTLRISDDGLESSLPVRCPECGARFVTPVDDGMSLILVTVGIDVQTWSRPAEVDERPHGLSPMHGPEVAEFAAGLDRVVDIADLFAAP